MEELQINENKNESFNEVKEKVVEEVSEPKVDVSMNVKTEASKTVQKPVKKVEERKVVNRVIKKNVWKYSTFILAVLLILSLFANFDLEIDLSKAGSSGPTGAVVNEPTPIDNSNFFGESDPMYGDENAPITIVEFSDYECPFCGRFYTQTLPLIKSQYVDTGKVNLVFRDFPLSFHQNAGPAAVAAECAKEQGKFWEYHDILFTNQGGLNRDNYLVWAGQLGLDVGQFESCIDSSKYASEVTKDFTDGQQLGVKGTPAFFINGKLISGAQPFQAFQQAIEAELAK